ncbi:MAG: hypothetical protein IPK26_19625 [Planctomycetes bacterium]|nr:hypothetical protein [Planctomycetota bacterium]
MARAKDLLRELVIAVDGWRQIGRRLRLPAATLAAYDSAFDNPCRAEARQLLGR